MSAVLKQIMTVEVPCNEVVSVNAPWHCFVPRPLFDLLTPAVISRLDALFTPLYDLVMCVSTARLLKPLG